MKTSPWKTFDTSYAGYGQMKSWPKPKRRPRSKRSSSRRSDKRATYFLQISPVAHPTLRISERKVPYGVGLRLVNWLRARGHTAYMY